MAYDKQQIVDMALKAITEEDCVTVSEVLLFLPISSATFYGWELEKLEDIKEALETQRIKRKKNMRRKWVNSDNPALQIAEFKLIASDDEFDRLNTSKVKQDTNVKVDEDTINLIMPNGHKAN